jgi:hypothetical protein
MGKGEEEEEEEDMGVKLKIVYSLRAFRYQKMVGIP